MTKRFIFALFIVTIGINMCRVAIMPEYRQIYIKDILVQASVVENGWIDVVDALADLRDDLYSLVTFNNFSRSLFNLLFVDGARILFRVLVNIFEVLALIFNVFGIPLPFERSPVAPGGGGGAR